MSTWTTPQQLAEAMAVSPGTVYRKIHDGEWPADKIGPRTYRFNETQVEEIRSLVAPKPSRQRKARVREALRNRTAA